MVDVISALQPYIAPVITGICLCIGYIIKKSLGFIPNKYIPVIMGVLGVVLAVWVNLGFTAEVVLTGLVSGLASTGLHQAFEKTFIKAQEDGTTEK